MGFLKHFLKNDYHNYEYHSRHNSDFQEHGPFTGIRRFLQQNKTLVLILSAAAGVLLLLCLALFIAAFPLLLAMLKWVYQNGISGIFELVLTILEKLWKGAGAELM